MTVLNKKRLPLLPVYVFLLGIYPVLYLWNANRTQQPAYVVLPSLAVTLGILLVFFLIALALLRSTHRAALVTTVIAFYLLTYGHFANLLIGQFPALTHDVLIPISASVVIILLILIVVRQWGSPRLTEVLNIISAVLVIFQLVTAAPYYATVARAERAAEAAQKPDHQMIPMTSAGEKRDVYFILVDNYGREDVLMDKLGFDNSAFVQALQDRGFIFPDCAQTIYPHTAPTMTSILNMDYLNELGIKESSYIKRGGYEDMAPFIQDSEVLRKFRQYGYHTVTFRGFMGLIDIQNSDTYISVDADTSFSHRIETAGFNNLYFETTLFHPLNEKYQIYPDMLIEKGPDFLEPYLPSEEYLEPKFDQVYQQNLYAFEALERIPSQIESPKFVYAHLYSAHWPFIHRPDGSMRLPFTQKMTDEGYMDALRFTNDRVLRAIDQILSDSETDPIIILQGDHSNGWEGKVEWSGTDRMKILSAYYLPDGGDALLYENINPVNNFRLIFRHYFGEPLEFLPDYSFYLDNPTRTIKLAPTTCISDH